jgi:hypothetical protein
MTDVATPSAAPSTPAAPTLSSPAAPSNTGSEAPSSSPSSAAPASSGSPSPAADFDFTQHLDKPIKFKVNGVDKELPLAKVIQDFQKAEAANERFNKAAELEKQIAAREELFKKDPRKALQEMGHNPTEVAQQWLEDYLKEQEMSPEQKELNELRKWREDQERTQKEQAESKQQQEFQAQVEARREELETNVIEAIEKVGLWKDVSTVQQIAAYMGEAFESGMDITPEMAARLVKRDQQNYSKSMYGNLNGEQLFQILGEDGIKKIKEYDLSRVKVPNQQSAEKKPAPAKPMEEMSLAEYNRKLRQELGL